MQMTLTMIEKINAGIVQSSRGHAQMAVNTQHNAENPM